MATGDPTEAGAEPTESTLATDPRVDGDDLPLGRVGRYVVNGTLGRGGMGVVLAAHDAELDRHVAIKLLHPNAWGDALVAAVRLEREAQAMARLSHPNVVTVYEVGRTDGRAYIAMEMVEGQTLRDWLRAERRPWRRALAMVIAAGRGLAAAHAAGLVHRDFKPANVLLGADGRPRVGDFGLVSVSTREELGAPSATSSRSGEVATIAGTTIGTPAYMAPEQWESSTVDARTDQFAFAVTAWEALWGVRPFRGDPEQLRARVLDGEITPVERRGGVPRRIEAALRRALAVDPAARWPDLGALLDALERAARDRRPVIAAAVAGGALALGLGGFLYLRGGEDEGARCRAAGARIDAIWSPERREALEDAFAAQGAAATWAETEAALDRWVDGYRAAAIETCEVGAADAAAVAAARAGCLERRRTELDGLLGALATPDPTVVRYAREAAHRLIGAEACRGVQLDLPERAPPALADRAQLDQDQRDIARAAALRSLGKPREAVAVAEAVARRADELGWAPLIAEAHLELGLAYRAVQRNDEGQAAHQRAAWHAELGHDDALRFDATLGLVDAAIQLSEYDRAATLLESARMIAGRLPADLRRDGALAVQASYLAFYRGIYADCATLAAAAIETLARTPGAAVEEARQHLLRGRCLNNAGQPGEVGAHLERALALAAETVGHEHPLTAEALMNRGTYRRYNGDAAGALVDLREALAIRERILGPDNPDVAAVLNNLGNALRELGQRDEARASYLRARAIWQAAWGPESPALAMAASGLGELALDAGDHPTAIAEFRTMLAIRRAKRPAGHSDISAAQVKLGRALIAARDLEAVTVLEEAVRDYAANDQVDPENLAHARLQLARALIELGVDPPRGRALVGEACPALPDADDKALCAALSER
jgi:tetratricopeptide (TPR) repeat protein